jgi:hypothetical protein
VVDNKRLGDKNLIMGNEEVLKYISIDQDIRFGKPCIKGTRISVGDILQWLSEGMPMSKILDANISLIGKYIRNLSKNLAYRLCRILSISLSRSNKIDFFLFCISDSDSRGIFSLS